MLKLKLIAGSPDRLAKLIDTSAYEIEISRLDESWEGRDGSHAADTEVTSGDEDA